MTFFVNVATVGDVLFIFSSFIRSHKIHKTLCAQIIYRVSTNTDHGNLLVFVTKILCATVSDDITSTLSTPVE